MKFCPVTNELCTHSLIKDRKPLYCVYNAILRKFEELKECPKKNNSPYPPLSLRGGAEGGGVNGGQ